MQSGKKFHREFDDDADAAMRREVRADDPMAAYVSARQMDSGAHADLTDRHAAELVSSSGFVIPQVRAHYSRATYWFRTIQIYDLLRIASPPGTVAGLLPTGKWQSQTLEVLSHMPPKESKSFCSDHYGQCCDRLLYIVCAGLRRRLQCFAAFSLNGLSEFRIAMDC